MNLDEIYVGQAVTLRTIVGAKCFQTWSGPYLVKLIQDDDRLTLAGSAAGLPDISGINPLWVDRLEETVGGLRRNPR